MAFEKITVKQFISAWFEKDYSEITIDEFKIIYSEYVDISGLFMSEDFERQSYIHHLNSRINYVKMFLRLQRDFIKEFSVPFIRDFDFFKHEYGYVLKWNKDLDDFEKQLKKVEMREIKHLSSLEEKVKELKDSRKNNQNKKIVEDEDELKKSRLSFIRMINSLGKIGYKIDKKETTVEELALMIKQQMEEIESSKK